MSPERLGDEFLRPISADRPCGENLEYTLELAALEAFPVFGRSGSSPDETPEPPGKPIEWRELRRLAVDVLARSKDLRALAHLATATLRTDGLLAFLDTPVIASKWLEMYWGGTYPLVDGDGTARTNALNCFADSMAVVDRLRRIPLVTNAHGKVALRDLEIMSGKLTAARNDEQPNPAQIDAVFGAMPLEELTGLQQSVERAIAALADIEKTVDKGIRVDLGPRTTPEEAAEAAAAAAAAAGAAPDAAAGAGAAAAAKIAAATMAAAAAAAEAVPKFDTLLVPLRQIDVELRGRVAAREPKPGTDLTPVSVPQAASGPGVTDVRASGPIASRQDAIRALDAVADFFRRTEPSSPIPLLLERAQRLVSKNFLEVLADVAPDSVPAARSAVGLPQYPSE